MSEDFFGPPPQPPPEPPRPPTPPWFGPPTGALPGVVALELVLARSAVAAVCVTRICAYRTGFEFDLLVVSDREAAEDLDPLLFGARARAAGGAREEGQLRFGVQFSDGAKATNVDLRRGFPPDRKAQPEGPVLSPRGGGGGPGSWRQGYWVWPLPPAGPLAFVCEWPAASIPQTRAEIDAQLVLDAAARAQEIFAPGPDPPPAVSAVTFALARASREGGGSSPAPAPPH
jgi:hypothetical protein